MLISMACPGRARKLDSPARLAQSKNLLASIETLPKAPTLLCGDFNLMPQTQSIGLLETNMKNLIKDFKIENTRNKISWDKYPDKQHFADFVFVTPEVKVKSFEVPYNEISDHLPMILEFKDLKPIK